MIFAGFKDSVRFQEFDGVVLVQGCFESFKKQCSSLLPDLHECELFELDKRTKEVMALIEKGGLVCVVLDG